MRRGRAQARSWRQIDAAAQKGNGGREGRGAGATGGWVGFAPKAVFPRAGHSPALRADSGPSLRVRVRHAERLGADIRTGQNSWFALRRPTSAMSPEIHFAIRCRMSGSSASGLADELGQAVEASELDLAIAPFDQAAFLECGEGAVYRAARQTSELR